MHFKEEETISKTSIKSYSSTNADVSISSYI